MTGAQEGALKRLKKKHRKVAVNSTASSQEDVLVSWQEDGAWGGPKTVTGRITPEGRVIELPVQPTGTA
jgi:hypothetical protein